MNDKPLKKTVEGIVEKVTTVDKCTACDGFEFMSDIVICEKGEPDSDICMRWAEILEAKRKKKAVQLGVPIEYQEARFNGKTKVIEYIQEFWAQKERVMIILLGGTGTGKTYALRAYQIETKAVYIKAVELLERLFVDKEGMMYMLGTAPQLIIDDLGSEFISNKEYFNSILDWIIDTRCEKHLHTLIATNLSTENFSARYGERIRSRVLQFGMPYSTAAKDLRSANAK